MSTHNRSVSNKRRHNGKYWTVRYENEDGLFINVGAFATREEVLKDIIF